MLSNLISTKIKNVLAYSMFVLIFFLISCDEGQKNIDIPKIGKDKMIHILQETHLAEATVQLHNIGERDSVAAVLYQKIFEMNQIEEADFYQSIQAYQQQPVLMGTMYDSIIIYLEKRGKHNFRAEEKKKNMGQRKRNPTSIPSE